MCSGWISDFHVPFPLEDQRWIRHPRAMEHRCEWELFSLCKINIQEELSGFR